MLKIETQKFIQTKRRTVKNFNLQLPHRVSEFQRISIIKRWSLNIRFEKIPLRGCLNFKMTL